MEGKDWKTVEGIRSHVTEVRYSLSVGSFSLAWLGMPPFSYPAELELAGESAQLATEFISTQEPHRIAHLFSQITLLVGGICEQAARFIIDHSVAIENLAATQEQLLMFIRAEQGLREKVKGGITRPFKNLIPPAGDAVNVDQAAASEEIYGLGWRSDDYSVVTVLGGSHAQKSLELENSGNESFGSHCSIACGAIGAAAEGIVLILPEIIAQAKLSGKSTLRGNLLSLVKMVDRVTSMSEYLEPTPTVAAPKSKLVVPSTKIWTPE